MKRALRFLWALRVLPPGVARFQWRAWRVAVRSGDHFSAVSATRPHNLAALLEAARGRRRAVELGTGTAWTSISLLLAERNRELVSYDPVERPERERYLRLVGPGVRRRLALVAAPGAEGPRDREPVELLYVDSSHERDQTIQEVRAWLPVLAPGALIVFDDFGHPDYPGVRQAVEGLGLQGERRANLFVVRADP
ncbi:MAG TPA: class I SAM-dependent methyltransferase [Solirubrobacteraceae bacterium]